MIEPLPAILIEPIVRAALIEDLGRAGDITTDSVIPPTARFDGAIAASRLRTHIRANADDLDAVAALYPHYFVS